MYDDEEEARKKLQELAKYYAKPDIDAAKDVVKKKAENATLNLGLDPEQVATSLAAAKIAQDVANKKLRLKGNITDNLSGELDISPREQAIRVLYNKSF